MPDIIACPQCKGKLKLPGALLGKKVRCPECKNIFVAGGGPPPVVPPPLPPPRQGVSPAPARKAPPPVDEVVEIDADDLLVEEEPPRRKVGSGSYRGRETEGTESPRARGRRGDYDDDRPRSRRRDEDYEEEEDRPRKRRPRRDEDYYDDEEDLDPQEIKRRAKAERAAWRTADVGVMLHSIANWLYTGSMGLLLLVLLIVGIMAASKSGSLGVLNFLGVLSRIAGVLWCINILLADVGYGFWLVAPFRHGAKGLAIACMIVGCLIPIFLITLFITADSLFNASFVGGSLGSTIRGMGVLFLLTMVLEVTRLTLFPLFLWAGGQCMRDQSFARSALTLGIFSPCALVGTYLLMELVGAIMPTSGSGQAALWLGLMCAMLVVGTWLAVALWGALTCGNARRVLP
jgi:hypothetical protein